MKETKNKVYIQLHYTVNKKTFSIFRQDSFFFPAFSEEEHAGVIEHIRNIMQSTNGAYMYLQRIEDNGRLHKGFLPVSDYIKVKMYEGSGLYYNNATGVITIKEWNAQEESFNSYGKNVTMKDFIKDLQEEIKLQENWANY
jgi:hypothetical protein